MKLLLTLTLGIASCGIGWGQEKPLTCESFKPTDHCEVTKTGIVLRPIDPGCLNCAIYIDNPKPKPVDVAAIWLKRKECIVPEHQNSCNANFGSACPCGKMEDVSYPTCEDKTCILEHDEQTPPKFYCRKPQTGDHQ